jgi:hypothetical protein
VSFAEHTHPADEQIQIAPDDTDELVRAQARADIREKRRELPRRGGREQQPDLGLGGLVDVGFPPECYSVFFGCEVWTCSM